MSELMLWFQRQYDLRPQFYQNLIFSIAVLVVLWLLRRWVLYLGTKRADDVRLRYIWRKTTDYIYYFSILMTLGLIWLDDLTNLVTYLGLLSAGIAIALSDPITNIAGWVFIFLRSPFKVGDRIQIGEHAGDVIDTRSIPVYLARDWELGGCGPKHRTNDPYSQSESILRTPGQLQQGFPIYLERNSCADHLRE